MGKLVTYMFVMTGIMLLFYFGGLLQDCVRPDGTNDFLCSEGSVPSTANSLILDLVFKPQDAATSQIVSQEEAGSGADRVAGISATIGIVGVVIAIGIGFITKNFELALMAPLTSYLLFLGWDFLKVFEKVAQVNEVIAVIIFGPLMLLWLLTLVEWLRNPNT